MINFYHNDLFKKCIPIVFEHEGGSKYTNLKNDPGGPTKYGISLLFLKKLSLIDGDIDHDGDLDADDIKALDELKSKMLYKKYFWEPLNLSGIENDLLCLHLFDHGVNAGTKTAVKLLQDILNVSQDGIIGPETINAVKNCEDNQLVIKYITQRKIYYDTIIRRNPDLDEFRNGWYNRINSTHF